MKSNFFLIIVLLTSCVKQEVFKPKHRDKEVVIFIADIGYEKYDFALYNKEGKKVYFKPEEVEANLYEDENKSHKGIFNGTLGFQGFLGFQGVVPGSSYRLEIIYRGDTFNAHTRCVTNTETIITGVEYESLRYGKPFTKLENTNPTTYYSIVEGTYTIERGSLNELKNKDKFIKDGYPVIISDNGYLPNCVFYPLGTSFQNMRVVKFPLEELNTRNEINTLRSNFAGPEPFLIPFSMNFEEGKNDFFMELICTQDTVLIIPIKDISETVLQIEFKDKDGTLINLKNFKYISALVTDLSNNKSTVAIEKIDTVLNRCYSSFNFFTKNKCGNRSLLKENIIGQKFSIYGSLFDENKNEKKSNDVQFVFKEELNKITLIFE